MHRWVAGIVGLEPESIIEPADAGNVGPRVSESKGHICAPRYGIMPPAFGAQSFSVIIHSDHSCVYPIG